MTLKQKNRALAREMGYNSHTKKWGKWEGRKITMADIARGAA